jgi:hypothetical protein
MSKKKTYDGINYEDIDTDIDNDSESDEDEDEDDEDVNYDSGSYNNEPIKEVSTIDRFFNTESYLYHIRMTLLGYKVKNNKYINTGNGLARTSVIDKIINTLRSIISTENILSDLDDKEANRVLLEKAKEVIFTIYDEESVEEDDVEHLSNMTDHPCQLFMGIIRNGSGIDTAKSFFAANNFNDSRKKNTNPMFRFGTPDYDLISIGGKKQ